MVVFMACVVLMLIGLYVVVSKRNIMKMVIGFSIIEYAVNLFFALVGFKRDALAPIITEQAQVQDVAARNFVDPVPQALVAGSTSARCRPNCIRTGTVPWRSGFPPATMHWWAARKSSGR